jgi:hypothetical protein
MFKILSTFPFTTNSTETGNENRAFQVPLTHSDAFIISTSSGFPIYMNLQVRLLYKEIILK